jgi:hypothetical protein
LDEDERLGVTLNPSVAKRRDESISDCESASWKLCSLSAHISNSSA